MSGVPTERTLDATRFMHVGELVPERDAAGVFVDCMPQAKYAKRNLLQLNAYGDGPFCRLLIASGMHEPGIYAVFSGDALCYVGICSSLAERWGPRGYGVIHPKNCYVGGQSTNCKVNSYILREAKAGARLHLYFAPLADGRRELESKLVLALKPVWNGRQT